ncbi:hypothetical protein FA95DRAFT_1078969 [Auriscalpium vulgare]|uniref:Uncharacterized protein n=1 Tax=Auriscalpium vulgare TaxID=40419 RepID=A0ACB8R551_9AGAM|nr:hypothetical protein FA95DRAFT_1078969 [Auriscalpium vulgare]
MSASFLFLMSKLVAEFWCDVLCPCGSCHSESFPADADSTATFSCSVPILVSCKGFCCLSLIPCHRSQGDGVTLLRTKLPREIPTNCPRMGQLTVGVLRVAVTSPACFVCLLSSDR